MTSRWPATAEHPFPPLSTCATTAVTVGIRRVQDGSHPHAARHAVYRLLWSILARMEADIEVGGYGRLLGRRRVPVIVAI
jgi:hypothetical protein